MSVVAGAFAAGLAMQGGMALWVALLVAAGIYAVMLSTHTVVRRAGAQVSRLGNAKRKTSTKSATDARQHWSHALSPVAHEAASVAPVAGHGRTDHGVIHTGTEPSIDATQRDPFHFRPDRAEHQLAVTSEPFIDTRGHEFYELALPARAVPAPLSPHDAAPLSQRDTIPSSQRDRDFEHLQGLIKQLAFDTRDAGAQRQRAPAVTDFAARHPTPTQQDAAPVAPEYHWLADAILRENVNVYLDPIQGLSERKPRHFEVSVRLLTVDGAEIQHRDVMAAARLTGMLPQLDAIKLPRVARIARRIQDGGQASAVLTSVSGKSLADQIFHDAASRAIGDGEGGHLVLGYAQYEVRAFGPAHWQALTLLAEWGLRFALEEVVDLDMDFGLLRARGFEFVKLDAAVLLDGMPGAGGTVPATDLCRYLGELGLSLIVGHIDDEWTMSQVLASGAVLGQGSLFGLPRPVRADVVAADQNAV